MPQTMFKLVLPESAQMPPSRVYLDYYKLAEAPFAITPDPEFLFSSDGHRQVLDQIHYAIDGTMGFVLLTGEVGTGKTTICRTLLDRLNGQAETVYIINPSVSGHELLAAILEDLGLPSDPIESKKNLIDRLNQHLLATHQERPFVVLIDDAQTMSVETLEEIRLLSNLETDKRKLIQVVLAGQPELLDRLADRRLRQLRQRIAMHCRLAPLSVDETAGYIARRLAVAGNQGQVCFSLAAIRLIHRVSGGIPRLINKISDFALTAGYVKDSQAIEPAHVRRALSELKELNYQTDHPYRRLVRWSWMALAALILLAVFLYGPLVSYQSADSGTLQTIAPHDPAGTQPVSEAAVKVK